MGAESSGMGQGSNNGSSVINISKKNTGDGMTMPNLTNKNQRNQGAVHNESMTPGTWNNNNNQQRVGSINSNPGSTVSRGSKFNNIASQ